MGTDGHEDGGLARGVVGSARVIAFGASNVAPASSVVAGLVIVVSYAGFASPLVVLTSAYTSQLLAGAVHVAVGAQALFVIIVGAVGRAGHRRVVRRVRVSAGRAHRVRRVHVLREQHRPVRPAAAVGWLAVHV